MPGLIKDWRTANPNIVQSWWDTDAAAKNAIRTSDTTEVTQGIRFGMKNGNLLMRLPSGRCLVYQKAHLRKFYIAHIPELKMDEETKEYVVSTKNVKIGEVRNQSYAEYNKYLSRLGLKDDGTKPGIRETVCFWGQNQTTKKWEVIETYGPRLVENFTQAIARDVLMNGIIKIEAGGHDVILDVHDEIVAEVVKGSVTLDEVRKLMLDLPEWCKNWPIRAEGFVASYYQK
jgi:DNA polymerase